MQVAGHSRMRPDLFPAGRLCLKGCPVTFLSQSGFFNVTTPPPRRMEQDCVAGFQPSRSAMAIEAEIPWLAGASRRRRWLVGVSGGADSVALLHVLLAAGFRDLVVCHLDHRLRGRASTEDAKFVRRLAGRHGLKCEIGRGDVQARMREMGESMETAARNARHEFFAGCALKHRCRNILLAHHADDQAETVLWNLLRGSHGMKGMREEQVISSGGRELVLIRPLLGIRRASLVEWLVARGIGWREDASNLAPVAVRNRLRNEVFPLLGEISGRDAVEAFVRGASDTAESERHEHEALARIRLLDPQGRLHVPVLRGLPVRMQRLALKIYLTERGVASISRELLERAVELLDVTQPAVVNLPGGRTLRRREGRILITGGEAFRRPARSARKSLGGFSAWRMSPLAVRANHALKSPPSHSMACTVQTLQTRGNEITNSGIPVARRCPNWIRRRRCGRPEASLGAAFVEEIGESRAFVAGDEFPPDPLVGPDFGDVPVGGDHLHDRGSGREQNAEHFPGVVDAFLGIGVAVAPAHRDISRISEARGRDETGFHQPVDTGKTMPV